MRKKLICLAVIIAMTGMAAVFSIKQVNEPTNPALMVTNETLTIRCEEQILFDSFDESDFTCTGITYDEIDDAFWIADYGRTTKDDVLSPRIVEINSDMKNVVAVIELRKLVKDDGFNLQGISFDISNNSLWIATGDNIFEIDKDGSVLTEISLGSYTKYKSNGIAVDDDSIWVLCYEKYLLKYSKAGNLLKKYDFKYADQDQICMYDGMIYCTVGADYRGKNNFIFTFNPETEEIVSKYIIEDSHSVEGITIVNNEMFIANDGAYHNDILGKSYISRYVLK